MKKTTKARKHISPKLKELMKEITPTEMEQAKVKMQLAARIEDMMKARRWTKSQFAEKVGKNPSEVTKWLSGTQNFTTDILTEIALAFGVEIGSLFGKRQVQVIYRQQFIAHSGEVNLPIHFRTPIEGAHYSFLRYMSHEHQRTSFPFTSLIYK